MTTAIKRVREALSRVFRRSDDEGHVEWHPSEEDALLEEGASAGPPMRAATPRSSSRSSRPYARSSPQRADVGLPRFASGAISACGS